MLYYAEIAIKDVRRRGKIVPVKALSSFLGKGAVYRSYYYYDEDIIPYVEKTKSVSGYKGNYYLPFLEFDIDIQEKSFEEVYNVTMDFILNLEDKWKVNYENIAIYFSGRGFHVRCPDFFGFTPSNDLPNLVRATIQTYFKEVDTAPTISTGLIRLPNSINAKSNLYKIGWDYNKFVKLEKEEILEQAHTMKEEPKVDLTSTPIFKNKIVKTLPKTEAKYNEKEELTGIVTCMQKLYKDKPVEGGRHEKMLRMGSAFRRAGIPREGVMHLLKKWAYNMPEDEVETLVNTIFSKGYTRYRCQDKIMSQYCDSKCIFYKNKNYTPDVIDASTMEHRYMEYLATNPKEKALNLKEIFNLDNDYFIYPGELVIVWGDTGIGKSTFVYNLGVKCKKNTLINSTEMDYKEIHPRLVQMAHGLTESQLASLYKDGVSLASEIGHISFTETIFTVDNLKKSIIEYQPEIVIVDTMEDLYVENYYKDPLDTIAKELKQMAIELKVIVIAIHHISKHAAIDEMGKSKALTVHSGKGASAVEQKADKVIGIEGDRDNPYRTVRTLKSRNQSPFNATFLYDWEKWRFYKK